MTFSCLRYPFSAGRDVEFTASNGELLTDALIKVPGGATAFVQFGFSYEGLKDLTAFIQPSERFRVLSQLTRGGGQPTNATLPLEVLNGIEPPKAYLEQ